MFALVNLALVDDVADLEAVLQHGASGPTMKRSAAMVLPFARSLRRGLMASPSRERGSSPIEPNRK